MRVPPEEFEALVKQALANLPEGCSFAPRCGFATAECRAQVPPLSEHRPGHWVACWHADRLLESGA